MAQQSLRSSNKEDLTKDDARQQLRTLPYGNSVFFTVRKIDLAGKIILTINKRGVHFFHPVPYEHLHSAGLSEIKRFDFSDTAIFFNMRVAGVLKIFRFETKQGIEICDALITHINDEMLLQDSEECAAANGSVNGLSSEESENKDNQGRVSRKARMLNSKNPKKIVLDLSFVEADRSNTTHRIAPFPTDGAVSFTKTTIRQFFELDTLRLNESERTAMLSALSVLQATPGFSDSPTGQALGSLSSLFTTCHAAAQASLDLTSKVQAFTVEKADIDNVATERDKQSNELTLLNENYEATEKLLEKAKAEVVRYEATLMDLREKSETLETSVAKLDQEVYDRGTKLTAQKEDFQRWNSTLQELEQTQAECYAKWEKLRQLDLN